MFWKMNMLSSLPVVVRSLEVDWEGGTSSGVETIEGL